MAATRRQSGPPVLASQPHLKTMNFPNSAQELGDSLNRTLKLALDESEVESLEAAHELFQSYRLRVRVGPNIADSPTRQAMLLTAVTTGRRCFLGGVEVELSGDAPLLVFCGGHQTLTSALEYLGANVVSQLGHGDGPQLLIGNYPDAQGDGVLRLSFDGWCAAVTPCEDAPLGEKHELTLAGVTAGALGVSEAFQWVRGKHVEAGRRPVALSLWKPELDPFRDAEAIGPTLPFLPAEAWLIGLGHLGQAYLWTLGMLSYTAPEKLKLVLQDTDVLAPSNISTSVLTSESDVGEMKTRAMAHWCDQRGFASRIHERTFADDYTVQATEPKLALCGVDNPQARACLEEVGYDEIIEAGLGSEGEDYLALRIHSFSRGTPARTARQIWGSVNATSKPHDERLQNLAYRGLEERGLDICGLTTLAGRAVGASFVGTVAATFCVAESVRAIMGAHRYGLLQLDLRNPQSAVTRPFVPTHRHALPFVLA